MPQLTGEQHVGGLSARRHVVNEGIIERIKALTSSHFHMFCCRCKQMQILQFCSNADVSGCFRPSQAVAVSQSDICLYAVAGGRLNPPAKRQSEFNGCPAVRLLAKFFQCYEVLKFELCTGPASPFWVQGFKALSPVPQFWV